MDGLADFVAMGGYGRFVWSAFGISLVVLVGLLLASRSELKNNEALLARLSRESESGGAA
jgi:heme exporter protein CcmD